MFWLTFASISPSIIAIACQTTFGRIVWYAVPADSHDFRLLWCPTSFMTSIFTVVGIITCIVQLTGVGVASTWYTSELSALETRQLGLVLIQTGIVMQVGILGAFSIIVARFLFISHRWIGKPCLFARRPGANWRLLSCAVGVSAMALTVCGAHVVLRSSQDTDFSIPLLHTAQPKYLTPTLD